MNYLYSERSNEPAKISCEDVKYSWLGQDNSFLMAQNFAHNSYLTVGRLMITGCS